MKKLLSVLIIISSIFMLLVSCDNMEESYESLDSYIQSNGGTEDGLYKITLGEGEDDGVKYTRSATRISSTKIELTLTVTEEDTVLYTFNLTLNKGTLGTYPWDYKSHSDGTMGGIITAEKYLKGAYSLSYLYTTIEGNYAVDSATKLSKSLCDLLLESLEKDLASLSLTAEDFGFEDYED